MKPRWATNEVRSASFAAKSDGRRASLKPSGTRLEAVTRFFVEGDVESFVLVIRLHSKSD